MGAVNVPLASADNGTVKDAVNRKPEPCSMSVNLLPMFTSALSGPDQGTTQKDRVTGTPNVPPPTSGAPKGAAEKIETMPAVSDSPLLSFPPQAVPFMPTLFALAGLEIQAKGQIAIKAKRGRRAEASMAYLRGEWENAAPKAS